jgi:hypothetical protein
MNTTTSQTVFQGDGTEQSDLLAALERNCTCVYNDTTGVRTYHCPPHVAFTTDQRFSDGLLWERHRRASILDEEHGAQAAWISRAALSLSAAAAGDPLPK